MTARPAQSEVEAAAALLAARSLWLRQGDRDVFACHLSAGQSAEDVHRRSIVVVKRQCRCGLARGIETVRGTLIQARLTQQELADMIGTTRETLAHTLSDFRRRDLLDTKHHQVFIRDAERLAEVAHEGEES